MALRPGASAVGRPQWRGTTGGAAHPGALPPVRLAAREVLRRLQQPQRHCQRGGGHRRRQRARRHHDVQGRGGRLRRRRRGGSCTGSLRRPRSPLCAVPWAFNLARPTAQAVAFLDRIEMQS